jgi:hypothetical protein
VGTHPGGAFYIQVRRENVKEKLQGGGGPGGCIAPIPTWKQKEGHCLVLTRPVQWPSIIFTTFSFSLQLTNGPNKLECYNTQSQHGLSGKNALAYWSHSKLKKKIKCCEYGPGVFTIKLFTAIIVALS